MAKEKEDIPIFIALHLTRPFISTLRKEDLHHNFPRKKDGILKEREESSQTKTH